MLVVMAEIGGRLLPKGEIVGASPIEFSRGLGRPPQAATVLVELIDVEVADFKHARHEHAGGCFLSLLSRPAAAASPLWPCCCCFSSLYAPPPGVGAKLRSTCM